jgi:hypothetical protein
MALAILDLLAFERSNVRARIDTGTNRYYQIKVGKAVRRRSGVDWVDEVVFSSGVKLNERGGDLLNSSREVSIPVSGVDGEPAYLQLFSFKTPDGTAPAFSRVVKAGAGFDVDDPIELDSTFSRSTAMTMTHEFLPARRVPNRTAADAYARQASWGDLLADAVRIAGPAVLRLIGGAQNGGPHNGSQPAAGAPAGTTAQPVAQPDVVALLLQTILGALQQQNVAQPRSGQQSLLEPAEGNRFTNGHHAHNGEFARPLIFGIDDALIAAAIGPIVQILPQLMNSANQRRVQLTQANNSMVTNLVSEVNRRMLLERLIEAQRQVPAGAQPAGAAELNQLIQLLQQAPQASQAPGTAAPSTSTAPAAAAATPATAVAPASAPAAPLSIAQGPQRTVQLSSRAVLSLVLGEPIDWNGTRAVLFSKAHPLQLKVRLNVTEPVPKRPLPKAIVTVVFKDSSDQTVWYEKTFKQKDVAPNAVLPLAFAREEASRLPINRPIAVLIEMRWLTARDGLVHKALGSADIVVVNRHFVKDHGHSVSSEHELTDMQRFRAFWHKVWESPALDAARGERSSERKRLWALDVNAKYSVLLSPDQEANGVMQTKLLRGAPDRESVTETIDGRLKSGIELSLTELNKLLPLLDGGETPLDREKLEAISTRELAKSHAGEVVHNLRLKGKAGERGLIWVVPVFKLFEITLGTVQTTDDAGEVTTVADEKIRFPLPVAARLIGLIAQPDAAAEDDASDAENGGAEYAFDGFTVEFSTKVALTPVSS